MAENIGVSQIKERDSRIDIVRVIAMLCIVMHHCIVNDFGLQQILKRGGAGGYSNIQIIMLIIGNTVVIVEVNIFFSHLCQSI